MHAGNIYASLVSWLLARRSGGDVVLRIEDLDPDRSKRAYIDQVMRDYEALGLTWDRGPYFQSDRTEAYAEAFHRLQERGLTYPCFCSRADVHAASAPHRGEKVVYAGTCRNLSREERARKASELAGQGRKPSQRMIVPDRAYTVNDLFQGAYTQNLAHDCGDFLVRRSDGAFAYQLAVVLDDADEGVDCVVRGVDLLPSTPQQMYLQDMLALPRPTYGHVPLLVARKDRRLSKRDHDASVDQMLQAYGSYEGIIGHIAFVVGLVAEDGPRSPESLIGEADYSNLYDRIQIPWRA